MKENLHRDYIPLRVKDHFKSSVIGGIIIRLSFVKVNNLNIFQKFLLPKWLKPHKDIYYWLPYKNIVASTTDKYSTLGSNKRFPFAQTWFEVKETCEIYEEGLSRYALSQKRLAKHAKELRLALPFLAKELLPTTRKCVIRMLDEHLFTKTTQQFMTKK